MDPREQRIRDEHPDWTDEQVNAELEKTTPDPPPPAKPDDDKDRAFAEQRRRADQAEKRAREAEEKLAARERDEAEKAGEWEKLAKQYEGERDQARQELADLRTQIKVEGIAKRLKFRHADEAIALLPTDVDRSDDSSVTAALEKLAEERKHLVDNGAPPPSGAPAGGGNPGGLTLDQIKAMSPDEINRRWDEVQTVLGQQK